MPSLIEASPADKNSTQKQSGIEQFLQPPKASAAAVTSPVSSKKSSRSQVTETEKADSEVVSRKHKKKKDRSDAERKKRKELRRQKREAKLANRRGMTGDGSDRKDHNGDEQMTKPPPVVPDGPPNNPLTTPLPEDPPPEDMHVEVDQPSSTQTDTPPPPQTANQPSAQTDNQAPAQTANQPSMQTDNPTQAQTANQPPTQTTNQPSAQTAPPPQAVATAAVDVSYTGAAHRGAEAPDDATAVNSNHTYQVRRVRLTLVIKKPKSQRIKRNGSSYCNSRRMILFGLVENMSLIYISESLKLPQRRNHSRTRGNGFLALNRPTVRCKDSRSFLREAWKTITPYQKRNIILEYLW